MTKDEVVWEPIEKPRKTKNGGYEWAYQLGKAKYPQMAVAVEPSQWEPDLIEVTTLYKERENSVPMLRHAVPFWIIEDVIEALKRINEDRKGKTHG